MDMIHCTCFYIVFIAYLKDKLKTNRTTILIPTILYLPIHATSRSDKNSLKHVHEMKNVKKKRNSLNLLFLNLSKNLPF